ncbi:hypothetical protein C8J57DRAFT_1484388 [Mycena rebaudengoi]|nr:hypothetical protein C8J57DRAFT_1484388 [Mycena rebaudengoi]
MICSEIISRNILTATTTPRRLSNQPLTATCINQRCYRHSNTNLTPAASISRTHRYPPILPTKGMYVHPATPITLVSLCLFLALSIIRTLVSVLVLQYRRTTRHSIAWSCSTSTTTRSGRRCHVLTPALEAAVRTTASRRLCSAAGVEWLVLGGDAGAGARGSVGASRRKQRKEKVRGAAAPACGEECNATWRSSSPWRVAQSADRWLAGRRRVEESMTRTAAAGLKIVINCENAREKWGKRKEERQRGGRRSGKERGTGQEIGWGDAEEGGAGREAEGSIWETQVRGTKRGSKRTSISIYKHTKPMQCGP